MTRWLSFLIGSSSGRMMVWPAGYGFTSASVSRHGLAGDGEAVAVEQAGVEQRLHERTDAADGDEFGHEMFAAGLEVGEHGHAFADAREVVEGQLHLRGVRDGEQVQHGVGRAAERDDDGDGVLERFLGQDVERAQIRS